MKSNVILIEFDDNGRPFSANTVDEKGRTDKYDVEWCERDQALYANESGSTLYLENASHKYWVAARHAERLTDCENKPVPPENRIKHKPKKYRGNLEDWTFDDDCSYCSICEDSLPHGDLCEHIWWDEESDWYSTPDDRKETGVTNEHL